MRRSLIRKGLVPHAEWQQGSKKKVQRKKHIYLTSVFVIFVVFDRRALDYPQAAKERRVLYAISSAFSRLQPRNATSDYKSEAVENGR